MQDARRYLGANDFETTSNVFAKITGTRSRDSAWPNGAKRINSVGYRQMKRRTLKRLRTVRKPEHHHHVYVVLLKPAVIRLRAVRLANPGRDLKKPCVYVGLTGLPPEERFANHLQGIKSSSFVQRYGVQLLPELYAHLNPMPYEAAVQMELDLAEDLRRMGYTVTGGH